MNYLLRTQKVCQRCGTDEDLTGDHIVPISQGGRNVATNLQLLCRKCNGLKGRTEDRMDVSSGVITAHPVGLKRVMKAPDMQGKKNGAANSS